MPLFSVVVPVFNKQRYIKRCVESILRQTCQDFDVVVVDDGSTDDSRAIVESMSDRRVRVIAQPNRGVSAARNAGIAAATGEVIAFLDGDDEWRPAFLEVVRELREQYPNAGILASGYRRCFGAEYGVDREVTLTGKRSLVTNYLRLAAFGNLVTSSSAAVPRTVIDDVGAFREGEPFGEDREFWLRIALRYPIAYDARILALYHSEAEGRACNRPPEAAPYPPAVRTLQEALDNGTVRQDQRRDAHTYLDLLKMQYLYWHLDLGDVDGARRLLNERYFTVRYRLEAAVLRTGLSVLPVRVVLALKRKPENLLMWLRQPTMGRRIVGSGEARFGRQLLVRLVPQRTAAGMS